MDDQQREQPDTADSTDTANTTPTAPQTSDRDAARAADRDRQRDTDGDTGRAVGGVAEDELRPQGGRTVASGADTRDADRRPSTDTHSDADTDTEDGPSRAAEEAAPTERVNDRRDDRAADRGTAEDIDDDIEGSDGRPGAVDEAEQQRSAAEFAQEHDPAKHDVAAGADARQPGDWTADEAGGPQVWDADGKLVEGDAPGLQSSQRADGSGDSEGSHGSDGSDGSDGSGGRTSSLDEVRDGG